MEKRLMEKNKFLKINVKSCEIFWKIYWIFEFYFKTIGQKKIEKFENF